MKNILLGGIALKALVSASAAFAQGATSSSSEGNQQIAQADVAAGETRRASTFDVDEIIVTAQKRAQSINDVGLTIQAVSAEDLISKGINTQQDLMKAVPGFVYMETSAGNPVYTLRGVGFIDQSLSAAPTVSVYYDEIPVPFAVMARSSTLDLQRLEVLKGPQGTLYGQNSTGGAFNFIAARPTESFAWGGDVSYGRFDSVDASAFVSGPIASNLSARLALKTEQADDWQYSYTHGGTIGRTEKYSGRLSFDWAPSESTKIYLSGFGWIDKSDPQAPQLVALFPQVPAGLSAALRDYPFAPNKARAADFNVTPPSFASFVPGAKRYNNYARDDYFWQASLRIDQDLTDSITLTSLSAYQKFKTDMAAENDGTTLRDADRLLQANIDGWTTELRLAQSTSVFNWVLGGNYSRYKSSELNSQLLGDASNASVLGLHFDGATADAKNTVKSYATFASGDYEIVDNLRLEAGVRYTKTIRDYYGCGRDPGAGQLSEIFNRLAEVFSGNPLADPIQAGECYTLGLAPDFIPAFHHVKLSEDNVSWRIGLNYKLDGGSLLYANVSKGYKAGSLPTSSAAAVVTYVPAVQEELLAYEAGAKMPLFDRALQLNVAGFYYDYKNKQLLGRLRDQVFGLINRLVNIPESYVVGGEVEFIARPAEGLTINGSATYLKTKITEYNGINFLGVVSDFEGERFPFAPKFQAVIDANYRFPISERLDAFVGSNLTYHSKTSAIFGDTTSTFDIDKYALVDVSAGIESPDKGWRLSVWGRNVTNKYYWLNVEKVQDIATRYAGRPATYGITFGYRMP